MDHWHSRCESLGYVRVGQKQISRAIELPIKTNLPVLQSLPVEKIEAGMRERDGDRRVVFVQRSRWPMVHPRHRDLARVQLVNQVSSCLAAS